MGKDEKRELERLRVTEEKHVDMKTRKEIVNEMEEIESEGKTDRREGEEEEMEDRKLGNGGLEGV